MPTDRTQKQQSKPVSLADRIRSLFTKDKETIKRLEKDYRDAQAENKRLAVQLTEVRQTLEELEK